MTEPVPPTPASAVKWTLVVVGVLLVVIAASVGGCAGIKSFERAQKRADANNRVSITRTQIKVAQQEAQVTRAQNQHVKALADQRFIESVGIRRAQDEISKTLSPLYIQHEAIQAMQAIATSGKNNTAIYIPSGAQGVPLVSPTPPK